MTLLDPRHQKQIMDLLILSLEGEASHEEMQILREILHSSSEARDYYLKAVIAAECIRTIDWEAKDFEGESDPYEDISARMWVALSREEKIAPSIEIPAAPKKSEESEKPTVLQRVPPRVSKFSIYSLLLSSAALIFLIVYAHFVSMRRGIEVATLTDSINAKWAGTTSPMEKGTRMATGNDRWLLREGYAELLFDNQTRITLEGPVEFQLLAEDRIGLNYGKVYARVPNEAVGFSVYTESVKIIDLGTEFGVQVELDRNTQVHVLKGKTLLIAGKTDRVNMEVSQGNAKKISAETGEISDIGCRSDYFVRVINSKSNSIWKGQNKINLADIVGGGNGFGTGKNEMGIDPMTGNLSDILFNNGSSTNAYRLSQLTPYVDGVFIPNGQTPQVVSSGGHIFRECPPTSGYWYNSIVRSERYFTWPPAEDITASDVPVVSCLIMHANLGITYDLQAIRKDLSNAKIVLFQSKFGIEKNAIRPHASNADFWVLVDGQIRYQKTQVKAGEFYSVDIKLSEKDRFLTLITTDGRDPIGRVVDGLALTTIDSDWCMFADPVLVLE